MSTEKHTPMFSCTMMTRSIIFAHQHLVWRVGNMNRMDAIWVPKLAVQRPIQARMRSAATTLRPSLPAARILQPHSAMWAKDDRQSNAKENTPTLRRPRETRLARSKTERAALPRTKGLCHSAPLVSEAPNITRLRCHRTNVLKTSGILIRDQTASSMGNRPSSIRLKTIHYTESPDKIFVKRSSRCSRPHQDIFRRLKDFGIIRYRP